MGATTALINHLGDTQEDIDDFKPYVESLDEGVEDVLNIFETIKDVSDNLSTLDDNLNTVGLVLTPLQPVPVVGTACGITAKSVKMLRRGVHPVRIKANQLDKTVRPVREALEKLKARIEAVLAKLEKIRTGAQKLEGLLSTTYDCLQKHEKTALIEAEDKFSSGVDPAVKALNKALTLATRLAKNIDDRLNKLSKLSNTLDEVADPINAVMKELKVVSKMLDPIEGSLKERVTVPYGMKVKGKWYKPWKWKVKTVNFTFKIQDILDGIDTGVDWVNDQLMNLARKALRSLNLDLPKIPTIPGLDKIEEEIEDVLGFMGQLKADILDIEDDLEAIIKGLGVLDSAPLNFDIKC